MERSVEKRYSKVSAGTLIALSIAATLASIFMISTLTKSSACGCPACSGRQIW